MIDVHEVSGSIPLPRTSTQQWGKRQAFVACLFSSMQTMLTTAMAPLGPMTATGQHFTCPWSSRALAPLT